VHPGDVLILVRRRGKMFEAVIKALKRAGVPVAGADRLSLSTHIAVEDLVAAGRAALLPQDDLTLAELLKSPLIGLTDEDLLRFAPERKVSLRQALRDAVRATSDARLAAADSYLDEMRASALGQGVFGFYARLLGPEGGRKLLAARLGAEAAEASDEVLRLALAHERGGKASLASFLDALETSGADIKRDLSAARGEVRVMTVHGAKGLEAPIVILADACAANERSERLLPLAHDGRELPVWVPRKQLDCTATGQAREAAAAALAREDRRLLYVAMTRARDRLIIAGCPVRGKVPQSSWYAMVGNGLASAPAGLVDLPGEAGETPIRRWRISRPGGQAKPAAPAFAATPVEAAPAWLLRPVAPEPLARPPLRPSSALDAADEKASPEAPAEREALLAGRFAHALLEHLPAVAPQGRKEAAETLAGELGAGIEKARREEIVRAVQDLISLSPAAPLFSDDSAAEVSVMGEIALADGSRQAVSGRIDRLAVTAGAVLVADFKTRLPPPGRRRARALAQLAIYRALLRGLYPGRSIRCFLVGLDGPSLIEPEDAELEAALALIPAGPPL
jgi:ATP-dependent helicase/nuclease subunit A